MANNENCALPRLLFLLLAISNNKWDHKNQILTQVQTDSRACCQAALALRVQAAERWARHSPRAFLRSLDCWSNRFQQPNCNHLAFVRNRVCWKSGKKPHAKALRRKANELTIFAPSRLCERNSTLRFSCCCSLKSSCSVHREVSPFAVKNSGVEREVSRSNKSYEIVAIKLQTVARCLLSNCLVKTNTILK